MTVPDWDIVGADEYPPDESVKLNGPPGTGKTTQAALRVATLLDEYGYNLEDVLWATYRKPLATETLDRLAGWGLVPDLELSKPTEGATRYIATLHACAARLAGSTAEVVGYGDKLKFAERRGLRFKKNNPWDEPPGQTLFDVFEYAAENLLDLHDPADRNEVPQMPDLKADYRGDVGRAWDDWQERKREAGLIDFYEQLEAPLERNIEPPHPIVVVDEYHDVTPLRARLAGQWLESAEVAIVAGDPYQAIYSFSGAHPRFFEGLPLPEVHLPVAHQRPPAEHWAPATRILGEVHDPPEVQIENSGTFHVRESPPFAHGENGWSVPGPDRAQSPPWFVDHYGPDTMFLARTRRQADGIAAALEKAGVLYESQANVDGIEGWGARDGMSERTALYNALQRLRGAGHPSRSNHGLGAFTDGESAADVRLRAREASAILDHAKAALLSGSRSATTEAADRIDTEGAVVTAADLAGHVEPEFWDVYGRGHGSVRHLITTSATDAGTRINDRDREALVAALKRNDGPVLEVDTKVYTIHAAKGSEAENVILYAGITNRIDKEMTRSPRERANEHRVWYVGLTRSRANLVVLTGGFDYTTPFPRTTGLLDAAKKAHREGVDA